MAIYKYQEVHSIFFCIVHVNSPPRVVWPLPRLEGQHWWSILYCLVYSALSCSELQFLVHTRPPEVALGHTLHPADAHVTFVKVFQQTIPIGCWNDPALPTKCNPVPGKVPISSTSRVLGCHLSFGLASLIQSSRALWLRLGLFVSLYKFLYW